MLKRGEKFLEKWGHYLLALLCIGTILLSAVWTNRQRAGEERNAQVLSDSSQRLSQVTEAPAMQFSRPCTGAVIQGFSFAPVYFPKFGVWQTHPAVDFATEQGDVVCAVADGEVIESQNGCLRIRHSGGMESVYRGLATLEKQSGDRVRAGERIGTADGEVAFEGDGHVCVQVLQDLKPVNFLE